MSIRPVILFFTPQRPDGQAHFPMAHMKDYGLENQPCANIKELYSQVQFHHSKRGGRVLVVLDGVAADNSIVAAYLRALYPSIGIISLVASDSQSELLLAMRSGADNYCLRDASFELLFAMLLRLLSRADGSVSPAEPMAPPSPVDRPGFWAMHEHGWVLSGPQQQRIPLTTAERAFLTTLFAQPELRASHRQLIDALNNSSAPSPPAYPGRLGLLVSRLRRKLREHGTDAPLKSLHRWGYMFTGPVL